MRCGVGYRHGSDPTLLSMAVVQPGSCSSGSTPSLGTSVCCKLGPKKQKKKKKQKNKKTKTPIKLLVTHSSSMQGWELDVMNGSNWFCSRHPDILQTGFLIVCGIIRIF